MTKVHLNAYQIRPQIKRVHVFLHYLDLHLNVTLTLQNDRQKRLHAFCGQQIWHSQPQKGKWVADKHIAGYLSAIYMIFHELASDEINTNKLTGKFNLGQLIISPLHCGLEKLQMTTRNFLCTSTVTPVYAPGWSSGSVETYREATGPLRMWILAEKLFATILTSCPLARLQAMTDENEPVLQPRWKIVTWAKQQFTASCWK